MQLPALIHLAEIVKAFAREKELIVLGSSSLLASFPTLGRSGSLLETTFDADFLLEDCDEKLAQVLDDAVGLESLFQTNNGYHADILRPSITKLLPKHWRNRLVPLPGCSAIFCLDPHDLAVAKLQAGRPKDIALLSALLFTGRLQENSIRQRIDETLLQDKMVPTIFTRLQECAENAANLLHKQNL